MLTVYKASAGSGKTYTLAYEYVRMLLGVKDETTGRYRLNLPRYTGTAPRTVSHRHILAITFTNKATEEMKSRIVDELASIASDHADGSEDCKFVPGLLAEYGCTRAELREVAAHSLRSLLFDYHHFNISTIDSFFQTVLRSFAREVDRQGDYGLELNDDFAVNSGIGLMLDDLNYGHPEHRKQMMDWIRHYTMGLVEKGKDGSLFNRSGYLLRRLAKYVSKMGSEIFKKHADEVLRYLEDPGRMKAFTVALESRIATLSDEVASRAEKLRSQFASLGFDDKALPSPLLTLFQNATEKSAIDPIKQFGSKAMEKILAFSDEGDTSFYVKKYLPGGKNPVYPPEEFTSELCNFIKDCRDKAIQIHALRLIAAACPNLEFLGFTWHYINRFRVENNLILLSDTNDLLQRIIGGSSTPFVYERVGVVLRNFLIDEFQDTSHMQWHNLKHLVANSISEGNDNLIIGDEKQAIYRFRNSDSALLHHLVIEEDFPDDHRLRGNCAAENTNYRSAADIVRFNNALFTRIARNCGIEGYENTIQTPHKKNLPGLVRIYDTSKSDNINDMPAEFELTAREILRQHEAGYRWSDIAVLVRWRREATAMVGYLLTYHPEISIISDEALLLRNSPAVKLVISMLKMVDDSYATSSQAEINATTGTPVYGSTGDISMMISRYDYFHSDGADSDEALRMALDTPADETGAPQIIDSIIDIRQSHPSGLVSLVETIIAKKVPPARRRSEYAYLAAFQDEVMKYCANFNPSVHSFLQWWEEASDKLAITSGAGQDAVSVMTIHTSKGLQWPCVHVPFGDWELVRPTDSVWLRPQLDFVAPEYVPPLLSVELDTKCALPASPLYEYAMRNRREQLADNINVTYVAYTRPERELIICFHSNKLAGAEVFNALRSPAINEAPEFCTDLCTFLRSADEDTPVFELGSPTSPVRDDKGEDGRDKPRRRFSGEYRVYFRDDTSRYTTIEDATSEVGDIMSDSELRTADTTPPSPRLPEALVKAAERGTQLHSVMADIDTPDDIDSALTRAAERLKLDTAVAAEYSTIIHGAFEHARDYVGRWFSNEKTVYQEQSIYMPVGDETLRPDRIIISDDGTAEVVDYKFTSEQSDTHYDQVAKYINLLRAMGYKNVTGYLWYPELNEIKKI